MKHMNPMVKSYKCFFLFLIQNEGNKSKVNNIKSIFECMDLDVVTGSRNCPTYYPQ